MSINDQIKRLLSNLAQAKTENHPEISLLLHIELKQNIKIESNPMSYVQISRANEMRKFEQELNIEIDRIEQQHRILVSIAGQQRRANSADLTNQTHLFYLFLK